ncbi:hypothetical protein F5Y16DRAFT_314480 [Xylariaceae sp. FL0255]|nr:hypothetical protein F5Y16DRAFT_314480 [Xylariaceae sp. FL0255]
MVTRGVEFSKIRDQQFTLFNSPSIVRPPSIGVPSARVLPPPLPTTPLSPREKEENLLWPAGPEVGRMNQQSLRLLEDVEKSNSSLTELVWEEVGDQSSQQPIKSTGRYTDLMLGLKKTVIADISARTKPRKQHTKEVPIHSLRMSAVVFASNKSQTKRCEKGGNLVTSQTAAANPVVQRHFGSQPTMPSTRPQPENRQDRGEGEVFGSSQST